MMPSGIARAISVGVFGAVPAEIEGTMSVLGSGADGGLIVLPDAFTDVHREQIIALAARHRVPTIYGYRYHPPQRGSRKSKISLMRATQRGSKPFAFISARAAGEERKAISALPASCCLLAATMPAAYRV
jgi:hypothetical protein